MEGHEDRDAQRAGELIEGGAEIVGATAGSLVGSLGGPPGMVAGAFVGVAATRVIKKLGAEVHERVLGPRQRERVGAALWVADARMQRRADAGETRRTDGFFDPDESGRAPADELLEGVLLQAANAYQERKVPHMGAFFASLSFREDISPAEAHYLLRLADRLSFRQLVALAYFAENAQSDEIVYLDAEREERGHRPFAEGLGPELQELGDLGLLGVLQPDRETVVPVADTWQGLMSPEGHDLGNLVPARLGRELYDLMELSAIPDADKRSIFDAMAAPTRETQ